MKQESMNEDNKQKSKTEIVGQHLANLINAGADRKAKLQQKEERFRRGLGIRLQVPKEEPGK